MGSCYQKLERHQEAIKYFKDAEKELSNPDVKKQEKYQMWTMVNYLNLRDAYGENVPYTMDNSNTVVLV